MKTKQNCLTTPRNYCNNSFSKQQSFTKFRLHSRLVCQQREIVPQIYGKNHQKGMVALELSGYTEYIGNQKNSAIVKGVMSTFFKMTGTTALLVGLQILSGGRCLAKIQPSQPINISTNSFSIAEIENSSTNFYRISSLAQTKVDFKNTLNAPTSEKYNPPDNGGPDTSQGSGTR